MTLIPKLFGLLLVVAVFVPSLASAAPAPAFYRGFALDASQPAGEMGNVTIDRIAVSAKKKVRIQEAFRETLDDHGGIRNGFAPRDPQKTNLVYLGTNHTIKEEGGQTGVFTVWAYDLNLGTGKRLASMRYSPNEAPEGYDIVGNEGTKLVVLKNIDGPYCERALPDTANSHATFHWLNLRNPKQGFKAYVPSQSMKNVFAKLPVCDEGAVMGGAVETTVVIEPIAEFTQLGIPLTLSARVPVGGLPPNGTFVIGEVAASVANGTTLKTCTTDTCSVTFNPAVGTHHYIAIVRDDSGQNIAWKEWNAITVATGLPLN